jgi:regulator of protease activity HflC (stomatin/prohibitin superfamily)
MGTFPLILALIGLALVFTSFVSVQQANAVVTTVFGKYNRTLRPGLNLKIPIIERVFRRISLQNRSVELSFQAITNDQANVYFKSMILYAVFDDDEETIKKVAFKFIDERSLMQALVRSVEGSIRGFVATRRQAEILSLRREIVHEVKQNLDQTLEEWGYHVIDLQINDITFDEEITRSMAQVVASNNLKAAAVNEGDALLIKKTKAAEADGNAIKIQAEAERTAAQLRGQGVALFRHEVAKGMTEAAMEMQNANLDSSLILFSMWTESMKQFAEHGKGNVIFLDGSVDGMQHQLKQLLAIGHLDNVIKDAK